MLNRIRVINSTNYITPSLCNGLLFGTGNWAVSHPLVPSSDWTNTVGSGDQGDEYLIIPAVGDDFTYLLGNQPFGSKPLNNYLITENGEIVEIDYIVDEVTAKLARPLSQLISGNLQIIDMYASPDVQAIHIAENGATGAIQVATIFTKYGTASIPYSSFSESNYGSDPISLDIVSSAGAIMEVYYV